MYNLKYKTISNTTPRGKAKVFFSCHEEDFDKYFSSVCHDIFSLYDCSIWYCDDNTISINEYKDDLLSMQLVVIPITTKLLTTNNNTINEVFKFSIENNIPILPLMKEKNLDQQFNNICGNIQFLDKFKKDDTGLTYQEKLKKFLSEILIKDEIVNKIKQAFDAYVFLSYRKKDRKHADKLMRLIHKNKFCQDIAIWYDEFLVPGEDFNDAIKDALVKSNLFVLTVTPNLVNENNYIINIEYPMALEKGKPILPVELVKTDQDKLKLTFKDFPDVVDSNDEVLLSDKLIEQLKIIATDSNNTPEHDYFIGLAYLAGIDVEVDYQKALELITSSADKGLIEAIDKLIEIYKNGIGTTRSNKKARELIQRKIKLLEETIIIENTEEVLLSLINGYIQESDYLFETLKYKDSIISLEKALLLKDRHHIPDDILITIYDKLAIIYTKEYDYPKASFYYDQELKINSNNNNNVLANLKMGKVFSLKCDYDNAIFHYLKALDEEEKIITYTFNNNEEDTLIDIYINLGKAYLSKSDIFNAKCFLEKAFAIIYRNCFKPNGIEYGDELIDISFLLIKLHMSEKKYELADFYSTYVKNLTASLFEKKDTINFKLLGVDALIYEGILTVVRKKSNDVYPIYQEALKMAQDLYKISNTIKVKQRLHNCYSYLIPRAKSIDEALTYHILDRKILETLKDSDNLSIKQMYLEHYRTIGLFLYQHMKFDKALEYYYKELEVVEEIITRNPTISNKQQLAIVYGEIGLTYYQKHEDNKALEYYQKQYNIRKELLSQSNNIQQILDYVLSCNNLSFFVDKINFTLEAIKYTKIALKENNDLSIRKQLSSYLKRIIKLFKDIDSSLCDSYKKEYDENEFIIEKLSKASKDIEIIYATYISSKLLFIKEPNKNSLKQIFGSIYQLIKIDNFKFLKLNKELYSLFSFIADGYKLLEDQENYKKYKLLSEYSLNDLDNPFLIEELDRIIIETNSSLIYYNWKNDKKSNAINNIYESIELINKYPLTLENQKRLIDYYNKLGIYYLYDVENEKEKSLMYFLLELKEKENLIIKDNNQANEENVIYSYYALMSYYQEIQNYELLLSTLKKVEDYALVLHEKYKNNKSLFALADIYYRYSNFYKYQMKDLNTAINYHLIYVYHLENLVKENNKYLEDLNLAYYSLSTLYKESGQEDKYIEFSSKIKE